MNWIQCYYHFKWSQDEPLVYALHCAMEVGAVAYWNTSELSIMFHKQLCSWIRGMMWKQEGLLGKKGIAGNPVTYVWKYQVGFTQILMKNSLWTVWDTSLAWKGGRLIFYGDILPDNVYSKDIYLPAKDFGGPGAQTISNKMVGCVNWKYSEVHLIYMGDSCEVKNDAAVWIVGPLESSSQQLPNVTTLWSQPWKECK